MKKILIVIGVMCVLSGCSIGKYEGLTAEEWFNRYDEENARYEELKTKYDELQSCAQEYPHNIEDYCL
jgi:Prokaryotic membrane lipoprotein lipid attachment site